MEARPDLDQRRDAPIEADLSGSRRGDAGQQLEQGALAGAIRADDAKRFAARHGEVQIAQRPEGTPIATAEPSQPRARRRGRVPWRRHQVALGKTIDLDVRLHQTTSATVASVRLKSR